MSIRSSGHRARGQSLVEFAIVLPIFVALLGGIIQFGLIFWAQNTITQVVRDTGRWAATQQSPCWGDTNEAKSAILGQANAVALNASLLGYVQDQWSSYSDYPANPATAPRPAEGVEIGFSREGAVTECPPPSNQQVFYVTIRISHVIPLFFPGMQYLPQLGTCDADGCRISLSSTAQYRMEPRP